MSGDETHRRRKSTRRRKRESSKSGAEIKNHESVLSPPELAERPATLDDLRKARLTHLNTPHAEKQKKMRYEYSKTVKVKETDQEAKKNGSIVSKAKSVASTERRKKKSRTEKVVDINDDVDDGQYVYGPPRTREQMPGAFASGDSPSRDKHEKSSRTKKEKVERPSTERRHTEPAARRKSVKFETNPTSSSRPALPKSRSSLQDRPRPIIRKSSIPDIPGSIHAIPEPETASIVAAASPRRSGSIFGSIFGAKPQPVKRKVPCLTCGDDVAVLRTAKLPCTHRMCHPCLERLFKLAVTDPAHMPPRCCEDQAISLKHVDSLFDQDFKETYNKKLKEYKAKNRIYCPARGCGEWIQPKHIKMDKGRKIGRCPSCKTYVCAICSQKMHKARDCPKDPATKEFVETAKKAGWQRCYNCNSMVELKEGCNHMTCRCTAEFCMVCGLKWKSCDCPWFSYDQVDVNGDPVRYQQELDRRREQEVRDEALARRMEALQVDGERPALAEWINLDNRPVQGNGGGGGGFWGFWGFGAREVTPPAMPGGWDDGPQQYEQLPQRPRRQQRHDQDPAAMVVEEPTQTDVDGVPVVRHRVHRRRGTAPAAGIFEGRPLTAAEREQERQIRAWATGEPQERH